jgi:hypothetical protein
MWAMAILAIFKTNKITKEMYETLRKEIDWERQHPDGEALHALHLMSLVISAWLISGNQKTI